MCFLALILLKLVEVGFLVGGLLSNIRSFIEQYGMLLSTDFVDKPVSNSV